MDKKMFSIVFAGLITALPLMGHAGNFVDSNKVEVVTPPSKDVSPKVTPEKTDKVVPKLIADSGVVVPNKDGTMVPKDKNVDKSGTVMPKLAVQNNAVMPSKDDTVVPHDKRIDKGDTVLPRLVAQNDVVVPNKDGTVVVPNKDGTVVVPNKDGTVVPTGSDQNVVPKHDGSTVENKTVVPNKDEKDYNYGPDVGPGCR